MIALVHVCINGVMCRSSYFSNRGSHSSITSIEVHAKVSQFNGVMCMSSYFSSRGSDSSITSIEVDAKVSQVLSGAAILTKRVLRMTQLNAFPWRAEILQCSLIKKCPITCQA